MTEHRIAVLFSLLSIATLGLTVAAIHQANTPPWKPYQNRFYALAADREQDDAASRALRNSQLEIKQILLPGLQRVDRCTTCHLGVDDPTLAGVPHPFRFHADLEPHRSARFGCTICHGGQGLATEKMAAHGPVQNWLEPRLPKRYLRASCGRCHHEGAIPGAPEMQHARRIVGSRGCLGCHRLKGFGNTIGPDLSNEARHERSPEWLEQHFRDPRSVTPTSPMPDFKFSQREIEALTFYLLSLTTQPMAPYYLSVPMLPTAEQGRTLFAEASCISCHSIQGVGSSEGPDLHGVTQRRSARWLERIGHREFCEGMPTFTFAPRTARALVSFLAVATKKDARAILEERIPTLPPDDALTDAGRRTTLHFGCVGCHGEGLNGGTPNPNSQGGEVPALIHLADDYTRGEVAAIIRRGKTPPLEDPKKAAPPLYMPTWRNILADEDIDRIIAYAWSLLPEDTEAW
ncbi:MAG: c-type cytochrome [Bryobacteraceae bacterium]|nr:c-type cytochrome [Bryobacteraceae bacterium]